MKNEKNTKIERLDYLFKIVLVGNSQSGKTALVNKYVNNQFIASYKETVGIDFINKTIKVSNSTCKMQVWDTSGMKKFETIINAYYADCCAVIICYDSTKPFNLNEIKKYIEKVASQAKHNPNIILVATQCDVNPNYKINQRDLAEVKSCLHPNQPFAHFNASAKTGENVEAIFNHIALLQLQEVAKNATKETKDNKKSLSPGSSSPGKTSFLQVKKQNAEISYLENIFCDLYKRFVETRYFQGPRQDQLQEFGRIYLELQKLIEKETVLNKLQVLFQSENSWKIEGTCNNPEHEYAVFVNILRNAENNEGHIIQAFIDFKAWKEGMDENVDCLGVPLANRERHREVLKALAIPDAVEKSFFNWLGY